MARDPEQHDIFMTAEGFSGRAQRILLDLEFSDAVPLPTIELDALMVPIEATTEGKVYTLTIEPGDPLYDLIAHPYDAPEHA